MLNILLASFLFGNILSYRMFDGPMSIGEKMLVAVFNWGFCFYVFMATAILVKGLASLV